MTMREATDSYREKAQEDGLDLGNMVLLSPRNLSLSKLSDSICALHPPDAIVEEAEDAKNEKGVKKAKDAEDIKRRRDEADEMMLRQALIHFRDLWNDQSAFPYISKYAFAEEVLSANPSQELLLRFITDRSFYFEQYRELGNLPGNEEHPPAPSIAGCIDDDDFWRIYEKTPADLLQQGLDRMKSEFEDKYKDLGVNPSVSQMSKKGERTIDELWCELAKETFQKMMNPEPQIVIGYPQILKMFHKKCEATGVPIPEERVKKALFGGYRYFTEEYALVRLTFEKEWLPTNIHRMFYREASENYDHLCQVMQRREDLLRGKERLIAELNDLATHAASLPNRGLPTCKDLPERVIQRLPEVLDIFETYARSQLHTARRKEFLEIQVHQDCSNKDIDQPEVWLKPYAVSICRLLEACWIDGKWHILTPLFLYFAFTQNSQKVIWNDKKKLVKKIMIPKMASSIQNMISTTGYRAGINLVLYHKLCGLFCGRNEAFCLLNRKKDTCKAMPYSDPLILSRMNIKGCALEGGAEDKQNPCPFYCAMEDWNDFGFYLTTGYSNLYHHYPAEDIIWIPESEIYKKKPEKDENEEESEREITSRLIKENERTYAIYRYQHDLKKPVGTLEGLLEHHILNCIPNRPRNLTAQTPNVYRVDTLHPPYEELANLLLQDMYLPAARRISRYIKRMLTEHPEYLDQFRLFMRYPWASGKCSQALDKIIKCHKLQSLILRYSDYSLSNYFYSVDDSLRAILEYMIRAQLIEEMQNKLRPMIRGCIDDKLFAYLPRNRKPRGKKMIPSEQRNT